MPDPQPTERGRGSNLQPHGHQSGSLTTEPMTGTPATPVKQLLCLPRRVIFQSTRSQRHNLVGIVVQPACDLSFKDIILQLPFMSSVHFLKDFNCKDSSNSLGPTAPLFDAFSWSAHLFIFSCMFSIASYPFNYTVHHCNHAFVDSTAYARAPFSLFHFYLRKAQTS